MNLYRIEQLKAEAIARCRKRMEIREKDRFPLPQSPHFSASLRRKHGL
jgi:hypothetical protein